MFFFFLNLKLTLSELVSFSLEFSQENKSLKNIYYKHHTYVVIKSCQKLNKKKVQQCLSNNSI